MASFPEARVPDRRRSTAIGAFLEGWRRVIRAPAVTASVLVATFLLALPLAMALGGMLEAHLGRSLESDQALAGWDAGWASEFASQAQGLGRTFTHEILGFGGTLANASALADATPLNPTLAGAVGAYILLWIFLSGGILDRFARARPIRTAAFFGACGVYFVRFLRLGVVVGAAYWALFRWLHPWLFGTVYDRWTRDMTEEWHGLVLRGTLYLVFFAALAVVSLVADMAKVRAVVEDRRSMLAALAASARFIRRRPWRLSGLYLLNVAAFLVIVRIWLQAAPSAAAPTWTALLLAQVYLLFRVWAKLAFMASEVVFFQGELAHAQYTAAPPLVWPDSPAAEAIRNLAGSNLL
jgi:hypothetical protein